MSRGMWVNGVKIARIEVVDTIRYIITLFCPILNLPRVVTQAGLVGA